MISRRENGTDCDPAGLSQALKACAFLPAGLGQQPDLG